MGKSCVAEMIRDVPERLHKFPGITVGFSVVPVCFGGLQEVHKARTCL